MSDKQKTKKELIQELEALRSKVDDGNSEESLQGGEDEQAGGVTRRDVLTGWVAPVILTIPLSPNTSLAAGAGNQKQAVQPTTFTDFKVEVAPTSVGPTMDPTTSPTADPTTSPTADPTTSPTTDPTTSPTNKPTIAVPTTVFPSAVPTTVIPVELSEFEID